MDCACPKCGANVDEGNLREILGAADLEQIRSQQLALQLGEAAQIVDCPIAHCKTRFVFEPAEVNY